MKHILWIILVGCILVCIHNVHAETTTINYKGQPPPSAISPSISAFSQDVCLVPVSGSVSSTIFGVSGGSGYKDENCERIKLAKTLTDLGLKVAAVSILCQDNRVFEAMLQIL